MNVIVRSVTTIFSSVTTSTLCSGLEVRLPYSILAFLFGLVCSVPCWLLPWWRGMSGRSPRHLRPGLPIQSYLGAVVIGGLGFFVGFFGPFLFMPSGRANVGPLLGLLITGPLASSAPWLAPPTGTYVIARVERPTGPGQIPASMTFPGLPNCCQSRNRLTPVATLSRLQGNAACLRFVPATCSGMARRVYNIKEKGKAVNMDSNRNSAVTPAHL